VRVYPGRVRKEEGKRERGRRGDCLGYLVGYFVEVDCWLKRVEEENGARCDQHEVGRVGIYIVKEFGFWSVS